jgi:hypothetical protein
MGQIAEDIQNNNYYTIGFYTIIDDFIDNSIDKLNITIKGKIIKLEKIEQTVKAFISTLDYTIIDTLITNQTVLKSIKNIIENYYYIYLILLLSFENNIDEIRKMLMKYNKIGTFELNTNNFSMIMNKAQLVINFYYIIQNNRDEKKIPKINSSELEEVVSLYDIFDTDEIKLFSSAVPEYKHNIIKTIIILKIFQENDRTNIFKIIENEELSKSEFTYIEVVDSLIDEIDYATIEKLFGLKDLNRGMAEFIYELLLDYENDSSKNLNIDNKINELFNNNILIPITDEFLRYHKDSEKYEKNVGMAKIDIREKTSKKDNTKIRYIVTKINKLMDYYNIKKRGNKQDVEEMEKLFFPSLMYRKAVIINELEEITIINKIINQGKRAMDNNEYYSDLISFRTYPYINFRDYNKYGFNFNLDNTVEAIRYCNFEFKDAEKYPIQYKNNLQIRVAPKEYNVNIVGVGINPVKVSEIGKRKISPVCTKLKDTVCISDSSNGYLSTLNILKKQIVEDIGFTKLPYWIFDKHNDKIKIKSYENLSYLNHEEYFKFLLSKIYDELVSSTYERIINNINGLQDLNLFNLKNMINNIQNSIINISNTNYYYDIQSYIYFNKLALSGISIYDKNENKIPGINTKLIKIPSYVDTIKKEAKIVIKKQEFLTGKIDEDINELLESSLCQHQVTWDNINMHKKKDPNKFNQELFKFIKKYVINNDEGEYICKSCYQYVDVKKYMYDSFSSNLSNVALSVPLEANLENIPEYEKYSKAIKNMDKNVEKIGYIAAIQYYLGNNPNNKYKRQDVVKYCIDLVLLQNKNFDTSNINMRKERLESSNKLYGIDKEKSTYFIFDMDNNLYTYSSKDTDKYKKFKNNNMYAYMIFLIICELNVGQIIQFSYDKIINYAVFDKLSIGLFDGIKIRINNGNDITNITNYKLLCYVIYYMSSMLIKYNLWYTDNKTPPKPNFINPQIQKIIIHTIADLINSILEINIRKDKSYIYEYIATKFFVKLNTVYDNKVSKDTFERLSTITDKKIQIVNNKIKIKTRDPNLLISLEKHHQESYFGYHNIKLLPSKYLITSFNPDLTTYDILGIDNLNKFNEKMYRNSVEKIYSMFLEDGSKRNITLNSSEVDIKILEKHANSVIKNNMNKNKLLYESNLQKLKALEKSLIESEKYQQDFYKEAFAKNDIFSIVDSTINLMEKIIGTNININNSNLYLKKTVYIINHDHLGNLKQDLIIFTDTDNKLEFKRDDNFFKTDVYIYVDKTRNITVYYHAYDLYLLGYKEMNREHIMLKNTNKHLKINHSIKNKLLLLGHNKINYKINDEVKNNKNKLINFTEDIIRYRIHNLKNIIKEFQMIIYQIKNKSQNYSSNSIIKQYIDKFKTLNYYNDNGERIFEDWNTIISSVYFISLKSNVNIDVTSDILNVNKLIKLNNNDNLLLYYLCQQIEEFITINSDPYNQSKLVYLLSSIINQLFDQHNINETIYMNNEVKKFNMLLTNITLYEQEIDLIDIEEEIDTEKLTDEQKEKINNEIDDLNEASEGMDIDLDNDMDITDDTDDHMEMIQAEGRD